MFLFIFIYILGLKCHYAVPICHIEWDGDAGSFQCHLDRSTGHDTARYNNTLNVIAVLSRLGSALKPINLSDHVAMCLLLRFL